MIEDIDWNESKELKRLVHEETWFERAVELLVWLLGFAVVGLGLLFFYDRGIFQGEFIKTADYYIFLFLATCIYFWVIWSMFRLNHMREIRGISQIENREILHAVLAGSEWGTYRDNRDFLILFYSDALIFKRVLTVIFDKKNVLVNCTSYDWGNYVRSPFHYFFDKRIEKEIEQAFYEKLKTRS